MERRISSGHGTAPTRVRSLFLSDLHLGSPHAQANLCLQVLKAYDPQYLYLVGDIIDGWKLKRKWYWAPEVSTILKRLCQLAEAGTQVCYTPGNHDDFLRCSDLQACVRRLNLLQVRDSFIHQGANGRRLLVTHGDLFDPVERRSQWLSRLGSVAFEMLLAMDLLWARVCGRTGADRYRASLAVKRYVKGALTGINEFRSALLTYAEQAGCDGVVCGHIHSPALTRVDRMTYCNTGDWMGSCTYVLERLDGRLDLMRYQLDQPDQLLATSTVTARVAEQQIEMKVDAVERIRTKIQS